MAYYKLARSRTKNGKRKKSKGKAVAFIFSAVLIALTAGLVLLYLRSTAPSLIEFATADVKSTSLEAVNQAVYTVMNENVTYSDLVTVEKNDSGDVTLITANTALISGIAKKTAALVQESFDNLGQVGVAVPIGTLSGFPMLTGSGPTLHVKVEPIGSVKVTFTSQFESAGINQTLHKINMVVTTEVSLVIPMGNTRIVSDTPVIVCESLIIGKVPQTYLGNAVLTVETP